MIVVIKKSKNPKKKYEANIIENGMITKVNFGAVGYEDYTIHKDPERKERYIERHKGEDWSDPYKAGFWAKHLLWNKPSLEESADSLNNDWLKVILYI